MEGRIPDGLYIMLVRGQNELHTIVCITRVSEEARVCVHKNVQTTIVHLSVTVASGFKATTALIMTMYWYCLH